VGAVYSHGSVKHESVASVQSRAHMSGVLFLLKLYAMSFERIETHCSGNSLATREALGLMGYGRRVSAITSLHDTDICYFPKLSLSLPPILSWSITYFNVHVFLYVSLIFSMAIWSPTVTCRVCQQPGNSVHTTCGDRTPGGGRVPVTCGTSTKRGNPTLSKLCRDLTAL
jgi:hypothetical protein